jgi:Arc/MetJ-type ribon-helix-helix transcriptional regulator
MKVSVSLPAEDVEFLDAYARSQGYRSRSAAVHRAVVALRTGELTSAYEDAWDTWSSSGEADEWDAVSGDGLAT